MLARHGKKADGDEAEPSLRLLNADGVDMNEMYGRGGERGGNDKKTLRLTVQLIEDAVHQRASDILIDPKDESTYAVRLRIDGILRVVHEIPNTVARAIINSVKALGNMDISERRRPQDGGFSAKSGKTSISFRVATAGALNGEKLSVRVLSQDISKLTLAALGLSERQCTAIERAVAKPSGMIIMCGPTGSGKTTTLYCMINQIDHLARNVISVEDPVEAWLPNVSQIEINAKADITFASALRSILRQNPDVICVGEIRDEETASIALRAAQTGHLVLATLHCESNAAAIVRLMDLGVSTSMLSMGLSLLISQRLLRRLCPLCKKPADQSSPILAKLRRDEPRHVEGVRRGRLQGVPRHRLQGPHRRVRHDAHDRRPAGPARRQRLAGERSARQGREAGPLEPAERSLAAGARRRHHPRRNQTRRRLKGLESPLALRMLRGRRERDGKHVWQKGRGEGTTMSLILALILGGLFVAAAYDRGFVANWVMLFGLVVSIYVGICLTPPILEMMPEIASVSFGCFATLLVTAGLTASACWPPPTTASRGRWRFSFPTGSISTSRACLPFSPGFWSASS